VDAVGLWLAVEVPFPPRHAARSIRLHKLIADYEALLGELTANLTPANHAAAVALAAIPEKIRGYGHVKARHLAAAKAEEAALYEQFRSGGAALKAAE
jgi:indolepyruvate ferredoxin oxidoreductase